MKCIGEFDGKCQEEATRTIDMVVEKFPLCEKCYEHFDRFAKQQTGHPLRAIEQMNRICLS